MANSEHTLKQYDVELESVRARVMQMGELVKSQVRLAIESLTAGDLASMDRIISDDHRVNRLEVEIDESCTQIIARRQPTAVDLRMVIKTITDLERIGDEAKKIAATAKRLAQKSSLTLPRFEKIQTVSILTIEMLEKSLDAFTKMDISPVAEVVRQDEQVDEEFRIILRYIVSFMMEDPRTISSALDILLIAKALERIGDHAKNMSEYVVYMVKGRDVRHISADEIERELDDTAQ
jgi:phosphate transport system protein